MNKKISLGNILHLYIFKKWYCKSKLYDFKQFNLNLEKVTIAKILLNPALNDDLSRWKKCTA